MKAFRRAIKVDQNDDTNQVFAGRCAFLWEDVLGMEDEAGSGFEWPEPRTWLWLKYAAFHIEGDFEAVFAEWQDYLTKNEAALAFTRN